VSPRDLDRKALVLARTRGSDPRLERALHAYSRAGEHGAVWIVLGLAGAVLDVRTGRYSDISRPWYSDISRPWYSDISRPWRLFGRRQSRTLGQLWKIGGVHGEFTRLRTPVDN
jgi:hypothetical protein